MGADIADTVLGARRTDRTSRGPASGASGESGRGDPHVARHTRCARCGHRRAGLRGRGEPRAPVGHPTSHRRPACGGTAATSLYSTVSERCSLPITAAVAGCSCQREWFRRRTSTSSVSGKAWSPSLSIGSVAEGERARAGRPGRRSDGGRDRRRSGDLALFRRALYQLSYPTSAVPTGFEPATSGLTGQRALQTAPRDLGTLAPARVCIISELGATWLRPDTAILLKPHRV